MSRLDGIKINLYMVEHELLSFPFTYVSFCFFVIEFIFCRKIWKMFKYKIYSNVMQMIGLGAMIITPVIGNLSDEYGRKALLTVPITLSIIPLGILSFPFQVPFGAYKLTLVCKLFDACCYSKCWVTSRWLFTSKYIFPHSKQMELINPKQKWLMNW